MSKLQEIRKRLEEVLGPDQSAYHEIDCRLNTRRGDAARCNCMYGDLRAVLDDKALWEPCLCERASQIKEDPTIQDPEPLV